MFIVNTLDYEGYKTYQCKDFVCMIKIMKPQKATKTHVKNIINFSFIHISFENG